ncbi:helix-turn-helix transcriptional regulator [Serratia ficaria]|uniref:Nitrogen regulation protein C n=1 Tax=Serratia ficaria TaxID=61651 RepID=A0A240BUU6_SERFI|nr:helix-turn-helix transcriptional regulator [Serratia ficaria]MEE4484108.1 helix-turn-helix transcriptional regulator [Serratia ficaria]REF45368.1 regulatory LuxR family protein [Serratia ficaria]CAI0845420.1 Nitrogen regulation protein C [Serratia ficaria]CAI0887723.1 Nitrogen regulation protein C [Serratia ficaria]CAI0893491.1 Nitrogen regulation protein C [Serratia ficaria]
MRVAIFSDDYYFLYGTVLTLRNVGGLEIIEVYMPAGSLNSLVYCNADLTIVSFSSLFNAMSLLSTMADDRHKVMVLSDVKAARLINFNCVKKNISPKAFLDEMQRLMASNHGQHLSPRELLVLALLLKGSPNTGVARKLGISEKTVSQHKMNAMRKLNVKRFCQLI